MTRAQAEAYLASIPAEERSRVIASGADVLDWANASEAAGDPRATYSAGGAPTTQAQAQTHAAGRGWSEDFQRFQDADLQRWAEYYDPATGKYRSSRGAEGYFEKPTECPDGMVPSGPNETDPCVPMGGAGGGGGYGGAGGSSSWAGSGGFGTAGALPLFTAPRFTAPTLADDPGYQFSLKEGIDALEKSAAARGVLRTGGTLKDIIGWGQDRAAQQYGDVFNRAATGFGLNYQGAKDEFAPRYGGWQTMYGGDLSRWTTQQNNDLARWSTRFSGDLQRDLSNDRLIGDIVLSGTPAPPVWS